MNSINDYRTIFFVFIFLFFCFKSFCQGIHYQKYTTEQGLPSSEVYTSFQDSKGYIWFGTDAGISKYNGKFFENFSAENGLTDNTVFGIKEDPKNRIWFRTYNGKLSYYHNGKFTSFKHNKGLIKWLKGRVIREILFTSKDQIIVLAYKADDYFKASIFGSFCDVIKEKNHLALIDRYENQFFIYNDLIKTKSGILRCTKKATYLTNYSFKTKGYDPFVFFESKNKEIIAVNDSIYTFFNELVSVRVSFPFRVLSIFKDSENDYWISTVNNGVFRFLKGNLNSKPIQYFEGKTISSVMEDFEHQIWITSTNGGVYKIKNTSVKIYNQGTKYTSIISDSKQIYLGDYNGNVSVFTNKKIDSIYNFKTDKKQENSIVGLKKMNNNEVMIFTIEKNHLLKNKQILEIQQNHIAFTKDATKDTVGNYYFISPTFIKKFNLSSKKIHLIDCRFRINTIEYFQNSIWIGTQSGLFKLDLKENTLLPFKKSNPLFRHRIEKIGVLKNQHMIFATKDAGIIILNLKNNSTYHINKHNSFLRSNIITNIYIDNFKNCWISTKNGIDKLYFKKNAFFIQRMYSKNMGIPSNEINQMTIFQNDVWLATNHGYMSFPHRKYKNLYRFPVEISSISSSNKKISPTNNQIVLPYKSNNLKVLFYGLSFKNNSSIKYYYRLIGIDNNLYSTSSNIIQLSSLPYQTFTLQVYGVNEDKIKSKNVISIEIEVLPPFWKTNWFILLCILLSSFLIFTYVKYKIKQIKRRETEKTEFYKQIAESELKALQAQMNPHFIFNVMNSIQYYINQNDSKSANKYLTKFARLMRNILNNSEHHLITIEEEVKALNLYLELENLRFEQRFTYEIILEPEEDLLQAYIPSLLIQPYIENAINHGVAHLETPGIIKLIIQKQHETLMISIIDNGIGLTKAKEINRTIKKNHVSKSLNINSKRLKNLFKIYKFGIKEEIREIVDENNQVQGTIVEINLPYITGNDRSNYY